MEVTLDRQSRYEALVRDVVEPLRRYSLRRTDHASAEDAVAEALLVMWRRLDDIPHGAELPWCYAVTRNCLANLERSHRRHRTLVERIARLDAPAEAEPDPAAPDPELHLALRQLPADDQEVLRLWAWEDLRPQEIAVVLGITANAASIRLHRAKGRLAAELGVVRPATAAAGGKNAAGVGHKRVDDKRLEDKGAPDDR